MAVKNGGVSPGTWLLKTLIDDSSAAAPNTTFPIAGAKKVTFIFTRSDHSSGNHVFDVDVSLDGTTFVDFNKLVDNVANTNSQQLTRVASSTLSSATSKVYSMDLQHDVYQEAKVTATRTTDGSATVKVIIEY